MELMEELKAFMMFTGRPLVTMPTLLICLDSLRGYMEELLPYMEELQRLSAYRKQQ